MAAKSKHADETGQEIVSYTAAEDELPSEAVIAALRTATGRAASPGQVGDEQGKLLDPIFRSVDLDALDALFRSVYGEPETANTVTFTYSEYEVTVTAAGEVVVRRR
ncbi:HalOD1 output domain-containing protein [Halorussus caseinilyticus]|uniref:HalOD1 output domain-containing protein n=1 Tax=Halorussus caseinilyticus TaxID=3034025 RepID=A0ABD5WPC7_9EURY|nr:HalOD1 output domain-containing protein [Halorussus sp. DT72]